MTLHGRDITPEEGRRLSQLVKRTNSVVTMRRAQCILHCQLDADLVVELHVAAALAAGVEGLEPVLVDTPGSPGGPRRGT